MGWINLPLDKAKWRDFVNTVMNLGVLQNKKDILTIRFS